MPRRTAGRAITGVVLVAVAIGVIALVDGGRPAEPFWERFAFGGASEVERYDTLADMISGSDGVITSRVMGISLSRRLQGDAAEDVVTLARIELQTIRVLAGEAPDIVPLEVLIGGSPEAADAAIARASEAIPDDVAVVFLHEKRGRGEGGLYRVVNSTGLWAPTARSALDTPLRSSTPQSDGLYSGELAAITDIDSFVRLLETYRE